MNQPDTFVAHDGQTYQGPPPAGWWEAQDGRWYPAETHLQHQPVTQQWAAPVEGTQSGPPIGIDERPWWRKKRFLIPIGVFILLGIAGSFVDADEDEPEAIEAEAASSTITSAPEAAASTTVVYRDFSDVDPFTDGYFIALEGTTLAESQGEQRVWGLGRDVCQNLDRGNGIDDELGGLIDDAQLSSGDASSMVGAAVAWICPQHGDLVEQWLDANS